MKWSKEPPSVPGAYMVKDRNSLLPAFLDQGDIDRGQFACFSGNWHYAISEFEWWFGPIPQPEEDEIDHWSDFKEEQMREDRLTENDQ